MSYHVKASSVTVTIRHRFLFIGLRHNADPYVETAEHRARLQLGDDLKAWLLTSHKPTKAAPHDYVLAVTVCFDDPNAERIASVQQTLRGLFDVSTTLSELLLFDPRHPRDMATLAAERALREEGRKLLDEMPLREPVSSTISAEIPTESAEFSDRVMDFVEGVVGRENVTRNPMIGSDGVLVTRSRPDSAGAEDKDRRDGD